jgi:aspartate kinase
MIKVFKFGGASLKDANAFKSACNILEQYKDNNILVVVSAMGKMTNAFENLHKNWNNNSNTNSSYDLIYNYHLEIINEIFPKEHQIFENIENIFSNIKNLITKPLSENSDFDKTYDQLIPYGEILSSTILTYYTKHIGFNSTLINAFDCIFTDNAWREGRICWKETTEAIQKAILPKLEKENKSLFISQGFIACSNEGQTITLGREGSDFTASIFAYAIDAIDVTIWKDVSGLFNADPKEFENVKLIPHLSYREAVELAYYGQSIIHPKTIKPLQNKNIPLNIKSFLNISSEGTLIDNNTSDDINIPCFILKKNQMLISISPKDFAFINERNLGEIFKILSIFRIKINMMQNSAVSFSFCADFNKHKIDKLINNLKDIYAVKYNTGLELITIRNYNDYIIASLTKNKTLFLEQRSRNTIQIVAMNK